MTTKSSYQIQANTLEGILLVLNRHLASIADRLDKLEGLRGTLETKAARFDGNVSVEGDVNVKDEDGTTLHSLQ